MLSARYTAWLIAALTTMHWLGGCATYTLGRPNPKNNPYNALNNLQYENQSSKLAWARGSLGQNTAPDRQDRLERTPLMIAAAFGHPQLISNVIAAGSDVTATDRAENTALMYAAAYGNTAGIRALLEAKLDPDARNKNKETALHIAASAPGGKADCVRELIEAGCDINARDFIDHSPLARAAGKEGDLARLRVLLEHNHDDQNEAASLERLNDALSQAASGSRADAIPVLLDSGADLQTVYKGRRTPLHAAANYGNRETINVLVQAGADLESHGHSTGATPLILAASWGSAETTQALIDLGADLEGRDESGRTALMHVATTRIHDQHGYAQPPDDVYARMDALLATGDDLEATDTQGRTALFHGVSGGGDMTRISRLLEASADVNAADRQGVTVLMQASANQRGDVVASLLELGAKVGVCDDHGRSALMWAAKHGSSRSPYAIDLLLQAGEDIDAKDNDGWPALAHAAESRRRGSLYLLFKNGADPSSIGWTPLHRAIATGDQRGVWTAMEAGADLEVRD
ncbi:MAG: ankyrin repeat domain-containing protein, partial [Planctomycetes bacterium]|nr:ankyrin repeat domain-containing protein [Planctomycetota bacterium]